MTPALKKHERALVPDFARLFDEYAPFVLRVMRHLGVADGDVQDQCQEVFVAVFQSLSHFEGRSSLRTWIYGVCRRVASNHRRRAYVRRERAVAELPERSDPNSLIEHNQSIQELAHLLDTLDEAKREVFVLYELEELTMKEVAEACECPLQTAYSRLHAARRQLLEAYGKQSEAEARR